MSECVSSPSGGLLWRLRRNRRRPPVAGGAPPRMEAAQPGSTAAKQWSAEREVDSEVDQELRHKVMALEIPNRTKDSGSRAFNSRTPCPGLSSHLESSVFHLSAARTPPMRFSPSSSLIAGLIGMVVVGTLGWACVSMPFGDALARFSYDFPFAVRADIATPELCLVTMDETAADALNQPLNAPWDRSLHAQLVRTLKAARDPFRRRL